MNTASKKRLSAFFTNDATGLIFAAALLVSSITAKAQWTLYASDTITKQLFTLDKTTAGSTLVGNYGVDGTMGGLAYDPNHDVLFGSDTTTNSLYQINRATGAATLVGSFGSFGLTPAYFQALAFDSMTNKLYGAYGTTANPMLYQINPTTGAATAIGSPGYTISGLSFNPVTHVLYGSNAQNGGIYALNPATGSVISQVSTLGFNGLSFDPVTATLYGVSNGGTVSTGGLAKGLYTINLQDGTAQLVGGLSLSNPLDIQFVRSVPEPSTTMLLAAAFTWLAGIPAARKFHRRRLPDRS
ncbi:MAG: hypothetical protein QM796_11735 [Chthoniobacteraceae bacterium]